MMANDFNRNKPLKLSEAVDHKDHEDNGSTYFISNDESVSSPTSSVYSTEVYKKRFLVLALFCLCSMSNAFQWIEYSIITNIIKKYYNVSNIAVNWTSVVYMVTYIPGIAPASWLLEKKGLRFALIIAAFGTCLGSWIKCASVNQDRFWITMLGQTIVASSQLFILNLPPRIAAVWFKDVEISRATAVGVFGNQFGIALGFLLPTLIVENSEDVEVIGNGLKSLFIAVAIITSVLLILIILFFEDSPKNPPSFAQAQAILIKDTQSYGKSVKSLLTNRNYNLILITYGLNVGVFYAVGTVLNQIVLSEFPDGEQNAGLMGLIMTISGMFGSVTCGYILDATHKYKETTLGIYICSFLGMLSFAGALKLGSLWPMFLVSGILGFFMTGYLPIGFEFAAEVSYPEPEGTSSGFLNASAQMFGMALTFLSSHVVDDTGDVVANLILCSVLFIGILLNLLIQPDLRRQRAAKEFNFDKTTSKQLVL